MEPEDPHSPAQLRQGMLVAEAQPIGDVGQICENCPDNWVEAGAVDEGTGEPLPGIGYRIYDLASADRVASGVLDDAGRSPRHDIPTPATQLYVIFGTEEAMDDAEEQIGERQRDQALQANARPEWNGIPAGLDEEAFNQAFNAQVLETGRMPARSPSLIGASLAGWQGIFD